MTIRRIRPRTDAGYTIIELLISMAIMLVVTGAIFELVNPGNATSQTQPEVQDMQQRMRVATDTLFKDIVMAGAGPYQGPVTGSLMGFFAPVLPRCWGDACPSAAGATTNTTALTSTISLTYIPNSYSQTTISSAMPPNSTELKVTAQPNCPDGQELCGFYVGEEVIIFDTSGHFDTFTITQVQDDAGHLQHRGSDLNYSYDIGASVTQVESHTYYLDTSTHQLMHYDGSDNAPVPVADNVVGLTFDYFGDPAPPTTPKPELGVANCLYDASGTYLGGSMDTLTTGGASMAPLPVSMFTDGPWCGSGDTEFDADLFRVRRVRVTLRVETPVDRLRGTNTSLFAIPGTATEGQRFVPDLVTRFEVAPRNMNLSR
ncbi:MAG TPA: prepilin-type N-terminal cleavage/methylation domain-containing protein [Vicinamibacterales bacterium]|nr:prepilin-type N-terminal cleavage/methylation domain-containing protein [Vicinamibacterales bacterium]